MPPRLTREQSEAILLIRRALQMNEEPPEEEPEFATWPRMVSAIYWFERAQRNLSATPAVSFAISQNRQYKLIDGYLKLFRKEIGHRWLEGGNREYDGLIPHVHPRTIIEETISEILYGSPGRIADSNLYGESVGGQKTLDRRFRRPHPVVQWHSLPRDSRWNPLPAPLPAYGQTRAVVFYHGHGAITNEINPFLFQESVRPIPEHFDMDGNGFLYMDFNVITPWDLFKFISSKLFNDPNYITVSML